MTDKVKYLFTNDTSDGSLVFRSTIESFGLDHTTDKDLYSFYTQFSERSYFDSGLLPVQGSGILSIRRALQHTQVAYQHAPGCYYINWADYEGQSSANKYYVAQPYRIVIIDFINDNLYGARTFYSPVPITHPDTPLYHTNLPNINCRGYRGNAVGWICLYHTDDLSGYPFNERLVRALDRCSGTETYNDANMSETDGTRFYREYRPEQDFLWQPSSWELKTSNEGWEWTLDSDLWIPILVTDWDHQDSHDHNGQPLTFVDALFGDYQVYYSDTLIPKPVNAIARIDKHLDRQGLFNEFKISYMNSLSFNTPLTDINPFTISSNLKNLFSDSPSAMVVHSSTEDEDEDNKPSLSYIECMECDHGEEYEEDYGPGESWYWVLGATSSGHVCEDCLTEFYVEDSVEGTFHYYASPSAKEIIQKYQEKPSICFLCSEPSSPRMSFSYSSYNHEFADLNLALSTARQFNYHSKFWGTRLMFSVDPSQIHFNSDDVQRLANELCSGEQNLFQQGHFSILDNISSYSLVRFAIDGMCSACAQKMLIPDEFKSYFEECYSILEDLVINGLCRLNNYEILEPRYQTFIQQMLIDDDVAFLPFH